ncbi:MAG: S8 family serine peptidase, partial [Gammaproteobacteria bacterium]|nr:S8 family serine peptidase [Gammaproteobacteria bacterium]
VLEEGFGGTSFAAPQVSGVAAAIFDQSPFLSADEVVDIVRRTAVDLGAPGVDPIYGHGLLNRAAALAPVGVARIPTGVSVGGPGGEVGGEALTLGAPFAYAILDNNPHLRSTLILDEFNRSFQTDLTRAVNVPDRVTRLSSLMHSLRQETSSVQTDFGNLQLRAWMSDDPALRSTYAFDVFGQEEYAGRVPFASMMLEGGSHAGWIYGFGYNVDARAVFGMLDSGGLEGLHFLSAEAFDAPYMSFGDVSNTLHFGYRLSDRAQLLLGWTNTDDRERFGHMSQTAMVQGTYRVTDALSFSASLSNAHERGGLFGGSSDGVFSIDDARTVALGAGAQYRINPKLALIGQYTYGYTRVDDGSSSLLTDFSAIRGAAYGLGMIANGVFKHDDRFGIILSRPLRVTSGQVGIRVPFARDFDGNIYARSEQVSLVPGGQETDIEVAYSLPVTRHLDLTGHFLWQHEPFHSPNLDDRKTVAVAVRARF